MLTSTDLMRKEIESLRDTLQNVGSNMEMIKKYYNAKSNRSTDDQTPEKQAEKKGGRGNRGTMGTQVTKPKVAMNDSLQSDSIRTESDGFESESVPMSSP